MSVNGLAGVSRSISTYRRLALSHNRLSEYSLDPSFSMLNRLRYLNLKGNKLKALPQCVRANSGVHSGCVNSIFSCTAHGDAIAGDSGRLEE